MTALEGPAVSGGIGMPGETEAPKRLRAYAENKLKIRFEGKVRKHSFRTRDATRQHAMAAWVRQLKDEVETMCCVPS
jgi:hypothetical protein